MHRFDKIKAFVEKERGTYKKPLTQKTTLEQDLKITGDDADEFIQAFGKEFNVNIARFELGKYFNNEGGMSVLLVLLGKKTKKKPLTLGDLEKAVETGELI